MITVSAVAGIAALMILLVGVLVGEFRARADRYVVEALDRRRDQRALRDGVGRIVDYGKRAA